MKTRLQMIKGLTDGTLTKAEEALARENPAVMGAIKDAERETKKSKVSKKKEK